MNTLDKSGVTRRDALKRCISASAGMASVMLTGCASDESHIRAARKPNVIIFQTDDQEFNTLGCYGGDVLTPHSDSIAREGICFTRGYTTTGVCMASRYGTLTGQYPSRCAHPRFTSLYPDGVMTEPSFNTSIVHGQQTIAHVLKNAGYKTGYVGKWGLGGLREPERIQKLPVTGEWAGAWKETPDDIDPADPDISGILEQNHAVHSEDILDHGFDYAESIYWGNPEGFASRALNYHNPEWITDGALRFIDENHDNPFFLCINHTLHHIPHPQESLFRADPRVTAGGYLDKAPDVMPPRAEIIERIKKAGFQPETAYATWLDDALGAVINRLEEFGLYDDTLLLFISDNQVPAKGTIYEGGVNVPYMIRYPRLIPQGIKTNHLAQNLDLVPTVFDLCGVQPPSDMHIDGESLLPMLTGKKEHTHDELFFEIGWSRAACTEQWKYLAVRHSKAALDHLKNKQRGWIYHAKPLEAHQHNALLWHPAFYYPDQLYDLGIDPDETTNLASSGCCSDVLADMKARMAGWLGTFGNHPFGELTL